MTGTIEVWKRVLADPDLLHAAAGCAPGDVAATGRMRRRWDAPMVHVGLELAAARRKAVLKFGDRGKNIVATAEAVEQASSWEVAVHKADRFRAAGVLRVIDLCCGVGGDAMGMHGEGVGVLGIDSDPLRAWMCAANVGCATAAADVADVDLSMPFHIDPARRNARGRVYRLEDYQPSPDTISELIDAQSTCAIKLSPGIDLNALPWPGEIEFISENGKLVQAVLWAGDLEQQPRAATRIGHASVTGEPDDPETAPIGRFVMSIDPALERSGLWHLMNLPCVHRRLGLLTSDKVIASPWLTAFEVVEVLPWRLKRVKAWLTERDAGIVEVKTRGAVVDPDVVQKTLRGVGGTTFTVFVLRFDRAVRAIITRRVPTPVERQ